MRDLQKSSFSKDSRSSKYGNKKVIVDGFTFDSQAEAKRYAELKLLERASQISDLRRQVVFELLPGVKFEGAGRSQPALRYISDFTYIEHGELVIEDVKSKATVTALFKVKRHILLSKFGKQVRIHQS